MRRNTKRFIIAAVLTVTVFSLVTAYFAQYVQPVVYNYSEALIKALAVECINNAEQLVITEDLNYSDYITLLQDSDGNVILLQYNSVKINRLARDLVNMCQTNLNSIGEQNISIPIGAFTGSVLLSSAGPDVLVNILPISMVAADFESVFTNTGINQVRHSVYINLDVTIDIILPISTLYVEMNSRIMVTESIIVGKVPNVYIDSGNLDVLDLVPYS